jgi:mannose-6-phosphate isomerase-like protein (cupin superfamily)
MAATGIKAQQFKVRTPLLKEGRLDTVLGQSDLMQVRVKCYAEGGENALHTHLDQDHTFVILAGKARFFDREGVTGEFGRNEGILLPKGAFYKFESCGDEPLVLLRVAAYTENRAAIDDTRMAPDGRPLPGHSIENGHVDPVAIEGAFYE